MKYIRKNSEPKALLDLKAFENEDWKPSWSDLYGEEKNAVKASLMSEQGHICCYCERRLTESDSHIEHFRPQSDPLVDPLDYANMLCSCQKNLNKGEPRHCGNLKDDWFDADQLISPIEPNCENRFRYMYDGCIRPFRKTDAAAEKTISKLGLGIPKLNRLRAKAIDPFLDEALTEEELNLFVIGYLEPDLEGRFSEFWTTIRQLFYESRAA